jgi:hypothetical protein
LISGTGWSAITTAGLGTGGAVRGACATGLGGGTGSCWG